MNKTKFAVYNAVKGERWLKWVKFMKKKIKYTKKLMKIKKAELIISLINAKKDLNLANKNFETAEEGLVDYYTYQIKANKSKVDFLVNKARSKGLSLNMIEEYISKKSGR